jgi:peptidoglycan/LPS O-acetylase OafA/YrhL
VFAFFAMTRLGLEAVTLFFVLSGFLVGGRVIERLRAGTFSVRDYAIDRFTRIYVPLVPALIYTAIVMLCIQHPVHWRDFVGNLLSLQGVWGGNFGENGALWSLSYEVWLYVLMGALAMWGLRSKRAVPFALTVVALCLAVLWRLGGSLALGWFIGALAASMLAHRASALTGLLGALIMIVGIAMSMLSSDSKSPLLDHFRWLPPRDVAVIVMSLGWGLLIPRLAAQRPTTRVMQSIESVGSRAAAWSYTLYLTHSPTLWLLEHGWPYHRNAVTVASFGVFVSRLVIVCVVAWLLSLLFEANTWRVRRWLKGISQ